MSDTLRARMLSAAVTLVGEVGYARMSVERVVRLSGNSEETFYRCFQDLDDCLLQAFEDALGRIAAIVVPAYEREREWPAKVRAALAALLAFVEDEPAVGTFVFVGALGAGPKVLACRMEALERLKLAFEHGIDELGGVAGREIAESSPLSAEGAVNAVLGILHTRLLEGSPLARRPLSELVGPLTAMIVLPYVGQVAAASEVSAGRTSCSNGVGAHTASSAFNGAGSPASKVRPKAGARKHKRGALSANQRKLVAALKDGPLTVRELVDATGLSDQTVRNSLNGLEAREEVVKTERADRIAYALPSTASNGTGARAATSTSNGADSSSSNGAGSSNGHDHSGRAKEMLEGLDPPIGEREVKVLTAIGELNARGSSASNHAIRDATEIEDPAEVSKLLKQLARLGLVESAATGRQTYAWRLTRKGTELLHELETQTVGA